MKKNKQKIKEEVYEILRFTYLIAGIFVFITFLFLAGKLVPFLNKEELLIFWFGTSFWIILLKMPSFMEELFDYKKKKVKQ